MVHTHARMLSAIVAGILTSAALGAQGFLHLPASQSPGNNELGSYRIVPWMSSDARVQLFYGASEVGAAAFTADGLDLRYDGPIPAVGSPGPFQVQRVVVRIGTTAVARPGPGFGANLSAPLTTAFDGPLSYTPDPGFAAPHPWGVGGLTFAFAAPVPVVIPQGGWLVVEIALTANNLNARAHAMLDAAAGLGGPIDGSTTNAGSGCAAGTGAMPASVDSSGVHAPGGVFSVHGRHLGALAPVLLMLGTSDVRGPLGPLPLQLPGTACHLYQSAEVTLPIGQADAAGELAAFTPGTTVALPPQPSLTGGVLHLQLLSLVAGANPFGVVLSDKRSVVLGSWTEPSPRMLMVSHRSSATAAVADAVEPYGLAVRLRTR